MKKLIYYLLLINLISLSFTFAQVKGHLLVIGGGEKPTSITNEFIKLAGGDNAKIVIIPNASSAPLEAVEYETEEFEQAGCSNVEYILCSKENVDADSNLSKLSGATGVFFSGGDQNRLTDVLLNSKLLKKIKQIYADGGVISGTSAGAAVMSKIMITGNELIHNNNSSSFNSIEKNNIETTEGFGFITDAVIDQHFIKRKRNNRLISVILSHPDKLGIAIDESTAILVNPDETFEVLGRSQVIVYDAAQAKDIKTNDAGKYSVVNLKMSILFAGQKFNLKDKKVIE